MSHIADGTILVFGFIVQRLGSTSIFLSHLSPAMQII